MRDWGAWIADRMGVVLSVGGAIALAASLWLPWFAQPRFCAQRPFVLPCAGTRHVSAWEAFRAADAELAALAMAAIALALAGPALADWLGPAAGLTPRFARAFAGLAIAAAGWASIALALIAVHRPALGVDPTRLPDYGFFVALLAGGAITAGGWWSIVFERERPGLQTGRQT